MNNLRQLCLGMNMYCDQNKGLLPLDGGDGSKSSPIGYLSNGTNLSWDDPGLWFNAIPPLLSMDAYYDMQAANRVPGPATKSIFVCPTADFGVATALDQANGVSTQNGYYMLHGAAPGGLGHGDVILPTYMCYVMNSKIIDPSATTAKISQLRPGSAVVAFVEKRMAAGELPKIDPYWGKALGQLKANEKRFAARHRNGGYVGFVDCHVAWFSNKEVTTAQPGTNGDYNMYDRLIWNPWKPETASDN